MLEFDFLEAADGTPLTKRFKKAGNEFEVEPYPYVKWVNSYRERVEGLEDLFDVLKRHAAAGHCMLKGLLDRPLKGESRAGHTAAEIPTRWVLLDLDFSQWRGDLEALIEALNPEWKDVSYIFQHSASAGIRYQPGLRGHLWILLDEPVPPTLLKAWLKERNLTLFKGWSGDAAIQLTANGQALKWPLDITTCQNDKLIYIAEPQCLGFDDPLAGRRFELVVKSRETAPPPRLDRSPSAIDDLAQATINELREKAGLPKRKAKFKEHGSLDILLNPDEAVVTGVREARGFVYLNLNGGDSWAYYFPADKPEYLYNFKGEPVVRLRDIAPDFYRSYLERRETTRFGGGIKPYVLRDPMKDQYYTLIYNPKTNTIEQLSKVSTKDRIKDFLAQFGRELPEYIEDWTVEFNPTKVQVIDPKQRWVNKFQPSEYILAAPQLSKIKAPPPVIGRVLRSVCGGDDEALAHFINWLACVFQTRRPTGTAWVFHGVPGTGKGLLLDRVLKPLFGRRYVQEWTLQRLEEQFNAQLEESVLLWLDEIRMADAKSPKMVMDKLKHMVTEPEISIRGMRQDTYMAPNWLNIIIASNHPDVLYVQEGDRRFNIAPAQERKLRITEREINAIEDELPLFASYLYNFDASRDQARRVLENRARELMIEAAMTSVEQFFRAIQKGDLSWLIDFSQPEPPLDNMLVYQRFERALERLCRRYLNAEDRTAEGLKITRDELMALYHYIVGGVGSMTKAKFSRQCAIHRLKISQVWVDGIKAQGTSIPAQAPLDRVKEFLDMLQQRGLKMVTGGLDEQ